MFNSYQQASNYRTDNTWEKKTNETYIENCDFCKKDTKHSTVKGSTYLDTYMYTICDVCGTKE